MGLDKRDDLTFESTKTYTHTQGLSACFRQWRAKSHCQFLHGYALEVKLVFQSHELDENNWVVDFGSLKPIKAFLEETFDHKTLVAVDDPQMPLFEELFGKGLIDMVVVPSTGCESFAQIVFEHTEAWLVNTSQSPRVELTQVEVREHAGNSAICRRKTYSDTVSL